MVKNNKKTSGKYGIKAYGTTDWFDTKWEYENYLMDWISGTEGAERDRAVDALANLNAGINFTDTDGAGMTAPVFPVEEKPEKKELPPELTDAETERIDRLHNETHDYLCRIIPAYAEQYGDSWNIDLIDRVCEAVWKEIEDTGWMTEEEFYPYRES